MKKWKFTWWIICSLAVGLIFSFYHWLTPKWFKTNNYSPLVLNSQAPSMVVDETIAYAPKVQEVLNGHIWISDPFLWEYKNYPSPIRGELVPAVLMAGLTKLGGGIAQGFMLADFIWPMIIYISLTIFFYAMTKRVFLTSLIALMIMLFSYYVKFFPYLPSVIAMIINALSFGAVFSFARSFHPQVSFPFLVLMMLNLWLIINGGKKKYLVYYWLFLGLSLAILVYTYFFLWVFGFGFVAISTLWTFWTKRKKLFKQLILAFVLATVLSLPYFINVWQFYQLDLSNSFIKNITFASSDEVKKIIFMAVLGIISRYWIKNRKLAVFWQLFYLTGIVLVIITKLTGLKLDDPLGHWMLRIIDPFSIGLCLIVVGQKIKKSKLTLVFLTLILFVYQTRVYWQYFKINGEIFQLESEKKQLFDWINKFTPNDSVIVTSSLTDNLYLPVYTHANVFIPRSQFSLAPDAEALERLLLTYKVEGISEERIKTMFSLTESNQQVRLQGRFNFDDCGGHYLYFRRYVTNDYYNCSVPSEQLEKIIKDYQTINPDLIIWKQKYRMDYWLWGPYEKKWAKIDPEKIANWQKIWENQNYIIYKIND